MDKMKIALVSSRKKYYAIKKILVCKTQRFRLKGCRFPGEGIDTKVEGCKLKLSLHLVKNRAKLLEVLRYCTYVVNNDN